MNSTFPQKKLAKNIYKPIVSHIIIFKLFHQNFLFDLYKAKSRVQIWLFENSEIRYEAQILGFDEYMNMVLEDCEEVNYKKETRNYLGRIMLKGDNVTLVRSV